MTYLCVLRQFQILQDGTCRHHTILQMVDTKSFQIFGLEMA